MNRFSFLNCKYRYNYFPPELSTTHKEMPLVATKQPPIWQRRQQQKQLTTDEMSKRDG